MNKIHFSTEYERQLHSHLTSGCELIVVATFLNNVSVWATISSWSKGSHLVPSKTDHHITQFSFAIEKKKN